LYGEETLTMKQSKTVTVERKLSKKQVMANIDTSLFTRLKQLRLVLANKQNVPAYIVFNDATLVDMCAKLPRTMSEFLEVSGVGNAKAQQYGEVFLDTIKHYLDSKQKKDS
ncbi:MAG: HRDC domain-containing protein, partial [Eubacterium sp.]|nr:HRDC domain-containing protein [Eubacterium sp.]